MVYQVEGKLLEVCTCNALCPCWVGADPDGGICNGSLTWQIEKGNVNGVDVSGLTIAVLAHVPGNILKGNWRAVVYVDDKATPKQQEAILNVWTGKLGGPVADLAKLIGEVAAVERVPITVKVEKGKGSIKIGKSMEADMAPFQGATGQPTSLHDTVFTTIPGSPAYVGKASKFMANVPKLGFNINLKDHNAVQGSFRYTG
ncbi:Uncharacterised protein [uncultured archaeon]|nr:Uncharacterised protein [uncultured archaeon]